MTGNNKKRICWVTPDAFLDTDLPAVNALSDNYEIHWFVILSVKGTLDNERFVNSHVDNKKVDLGFYQFQTHIRSPKHIHEILGIIKEVKKVNPDLYYLSENFPPLGFLLYRFMLPLNKCVVPCHNVTTPKGAKKAWFARAYTHLWLNTFKNIQTFSEYQEKELKLHYKGKNVLMTHFFLKDYGEPSCKTNKDDLPYIRFLVFGNIVHYKRIDLLIKAVNILWNRGIRNFKVRIAGSCGQWETEYAPLIQHPDLFELNIKRIPNEDVANLFVDSHYFVMPYQDIAQSGAITVAFRYNVPVIVSDIPQFKEFVKDGETGFTFHTKDAQALADKMEWVIANHNNVYPKVCANLKRFVEENLSLDAIKQKYITYFDKL